MSEPTRAVVIEGVPLIRAGISSVLREHHVAVVAESSSAEDASSLVRGSDAHLLVVGDDGSCVALVAAIRRVKERGGDVAVVALVPPCTREVLLSILEAGADAIVPSEVDREELLTAVEAVRIGQRHIAPAVTAALFADIKSSDARHVTAASVLTSRERAIVRLVAQGDTNEAIGASLFISPATVKTHLSNAYVKLGARNRYDAVVKATQLGLL